MHDDDETVLSHLPRTPKTKERSYTNNNSSRGFSSSLSTPVVNEGIEINPLISLANPLLAIGVGLSRQEIAPDINHLQTILHREVDNFRQSLSREHQDLVANASYVLCAFLDENIMYRPWGTAWGERPLLLEFCGDNQGGERFFDKLEQAREELVRQDNPRTKENLIYLLELMYVCLSFGYGGKHKLYGNKEKLGEIKSDLFRFINNFRHFEGTDKALAVHWQGSPTEKIKSRWKYLALGAALLASLWGALYYYYLSSLDSRKDEVVNMLSIAPNKLKLVDNRFQFDIQDPEVIYVTSPVLQQTAEEIIFEQLEKQTKFIYFDRGKHTLMRNDTKALDEFLAYLSEQCRSLDRVIPLGIKIDLLGRASPIGSAAANQRLSHKRMRAVQSYLNRYSDACLNVKILPGQALGDTDILPPEKGKTQNEMNRSVEITIIQVT